MRPNPINQNKAYFGIILVFWLFYFRVAAKYLSTFIINNNGLINFLVYVISFSIIMIIIFFYKAKINLKLRWQDTYIIILGYLFISFFDYSADFVYRYISNDNLNLPANQISWNAIKKQAPFYYYVTAILIGPIVEELFYRFGFQNWFKKYISTFWSIVITSLIFGFLHIWHGLFVKRNLIELVYLISYSGASIIFSIVYFKTKRLSAPILLHILVNFIAIL